MNRVEPAGQVDANVQELETVARLKAEVATLRAELASYRRADATAQLQAGFARTMIDEMYQFVALLDVEGRLLEVNLPALTGVGVTRAEVIGRPMPDVHAWQVSKEVNDRVRQSIRDAAQGQFVRYETLLYGGNAGKDAIWIDYSLAPVRDSSGEIVFLLGEGRNITEKKIAEVELTRKSEELQAAHEKLKEFDRLKTDFFANVSHELRTPLALILGPVRRQLANPELPSDERHDLEVVQRNAQTLLKHVNDLLDLSKLEAGRMVAYYSNVDLARLVRLVASHFDVLAAERQIHYSIEAPERLNAQVDAEKVQRVLLNLLSNAFKFTPSGGRIQVQLTAEDQNLRIQVRDSGPGIPAELRQAIFERFRQADGTSTRRQGGTGLGLTIVKEFVDLHGGTIDLDEAPGGGARFAIAIPVGAPLGADLHDAQSLDEEAAVQTVSELRPITASVAPQVATSAPTVMVVEDNLEMNAFIAETLGRDYRVVTALDGQEGLAKAMSCSPELIISDVMMPRLSGDEMVRELRTRPELADVPIIMLTAKADDQLRVKLLKNTVQDYIAKPFLAEELLAKATALINKRRNVQEKLQAAQRQISTILDHAPVAVYIKDLTGRLTFVNQEVAAIFGRPAEELLGKSNQDLLPPELAEAVDANDQAALLAEQPLQVEETVLRSGAAHTYLSVKFPLSDEQGQVYAMCGISTDISDKKRIENELSRAKQAAEQANQAKDHFLAVVSHELRTPLSPILTATNLLQLHEDLPADVRKPLEIILRNVEQEIRLVDDLLRWTRLAHCKLDLHQEVVDAHELVRTVLSEFHVEMDSKAIELSIGLRAKNRFIWADPGRMQQVLSNLIGNAVKFTPQGGRIALRTSDIEDGKLRIEIDDSGIGIEPHVLPKLFHPFEQGERTRTRRFGGLGLGLAISKGIVELHDGCLSAHSAGKDRGATFTIDMNATFITPLLPESDGASDARVDRSRRLLLVEDHRDTLQVMTTTLTRIGYRVATATNVAEALRLIDREPFDLLVSDIGLPDGTGLDIMCHAKQAHQLKGIALSGFSAEEDQLRSKQAGFSEHLTKPVDLQRLRHAIEQVLAN
jgi:PAS domain S-box-containing protein